MEGKVDHGTKSHYCTILCMSVLLLFPAKGGSINLAETNPAQFIVFPRP